MTITTTKLNELDKREIENCYIIGKLAEESYDLPRLGEDLKPITFTYKKDPERIVFYIQPISPEPELLLNKLGKSPSEVYISFDTHSRRYFESKKLNQAENRLEAYKEHLENKLILFKPRLTYDDLKSTYHYNIDLVFVDDDNLEPGTYFPIPSMAKVTTSMRFKKILQEGKPFQLPSYNSYMDLPEFIVCDRHIYHFTDPDALRKSETNPNTYYCNHPEVVTEIQLPENWSYMTKGVYKEISFISYDNAIKIRDMEGKSIVDTESITKIVNETEEVKVDRKKSSNDSSDSSMSEEDTENNNIEEHNFIYRLDYLARQKKLTYILEDLINFHTSLKTSRFTILGGMSGTGKTELANLYAEALGLKINNRLKVVSVKPSFTEPSDILGFFNHQTGVFMESETGLVSFLKKAEKNPTELFMVIFDEMNLGQVEHYFSDFISILELSEDQQRLELVSPNSLCYQPDIKEGISIGNNVLFVGTANFDETTKDFSNRLLDRANVIRLDKPNFIDSKRREENSFDSTSQYEAAEGNELKNITDAITADLFNNWVIKEKGLKSLEDAELDLLDRIHEEISSFDSQTGVSFRIAKQIGHYLDNIPLDEDNHPMMPRHVTFDYQIKQRILSKIRGHRDQIDQLVGSYDEHNQKFAPGRLGLIIADLQEEEELSISVKFLQQKAKELMRNGYTL
jgi:hypothetical protein